MIQTAIDMVVGVGVVGGRSEILDPSDDDDDGLPRTKKERSAEAPRPLEPALGDQFNVRRKAVFPAAI